MRQKTFHNIYAWKRLIRQIMNWSLYLTWWAQSYSLAWELQCLFARKITGLLLQYSLLPPHPLQWRCCIIEIVLIKDKILPHSVSQKSKGRREPLATHSEHNRVIFLNAATKVHLRGEGYRYPKRQAEIKYFERTPLGGSIAHDGEVSMRLSAWVHKLF